MKRIPNPARRLLAPLALAPLLLTLLAALSAAARAQATDEVWQLVYFDEAKVGFVHQVTEPADTEGKKLVRRNTDSSLTINRLGTSITVVTSGWTLEDDKGGVLEMYSEQNLSAA